MRADVKNSTICQRVSRVLARRSAAVLAMVAALTIAVPLPGTAQNSSSNEPFVSGESLRVMCTSSWGHMAYLEMYAACRAYVAGIADVLADGQVVANSRACFGPEATKGQATEAVVAWMRAHPETETKGLTAVQITTMALAQKYPCSWRRSDGDTKNGRDKHLVR